MSRRNPLDIMADILRVSEGGCNKTSIMYEARMSFAQTNVYLEQLQQLGFMRVEEKDGRMFYQTTEKGMEFCDVYGELMSMFAPKRRGFKVG